MLAAPGGLFLDVKSAYSSAADLQVFTAALAGIGVHVKARRFRFCLKFTLLLLYAAVLLLQPFAV